MKLLGHARGRRILIAAGLLAIASACGPRAGTGTYQLRTVNGRPLPASAGSHPQGSAEIVSGSVTLNRNGSYQHRVLLRIRYDTLTYADSVVQVGRYKLKSGGVLLKNRGGDMRGQLSDGILTLDVEGSRYRYQRLTTQRGKD